ncbi:hypothetical protein ATO3_22590 [Marinibacterium profundimaris]|uniref:Uncharacterized protein n=1 Tax=Marinibacterium profundimaris TaxID=1679460 RepID=A0A225NCU0_9RHOB|nr:hypothetical protein ATO3_22590 [Marinibacterium profundimaris]
MGFVWPFIVWVVAPMLLFPWQTAGKFAQNNCTGTHAIQHPPPCDRHDRTHMCDWPRPDPDEKSPSLRTAL